MLGFGMCLLSGFMIGYVQGLRSVVDAVGNIVYGVARSMGLYAGVTDTITGFVQLRINPNYASFWEFGVLIAIGGFILVVRGDRKRNTEENQAPEDSQSASIQM